MTDSVRLPGPVRDWKGDAWRLGLVLLLAVGVRAWMVANTTLVSRDCIKFVRDALHLEDAPTLGDRLGVVKNAEHPPGYPAAILGMSKLVRLGTGGVTVETMALSAQLVSAAAGVLLVFPLWLLTRRMFDRNTACAAIAVFATLPVCVEVTSDGISDGLFLLTAAWALWFAVRALEPDRAGLALRFGLGSGLCCGVGYLVRPDSAIVAAAIGLTFAGLVIARWRRGGPVRPPLAAGVGLVVGALAVAGPYVGLIGKLTNKPSGNQFIEQIQGKEAKPTYFQRSQLGAGRVPLASWWNAADAGGQSKAAWAFEALASEYSKAAHYSLTVFALIGLYALRRRLNDARVALLLVTAAVYLTVLWLLAYHIGYVSQRHTLLTVMISCILAACSFPALGAWAIQAWRTRSVARFGLRMFTPLTGRAGARHAIVRLRRVSPWALGTIWTILLLAPALPRDFYSLHAERAGHKAAGKYLAECGDPDIEIVDPFGWAEWYSGRSLRTSIAPQPYDGKPKYVIFEPNAKSPHSRLEYYETARALKERTRQIKFQYPANASPDEIRVAVYLFEPKRK